MNTSSRKFCISDFPQASKNSKGEEGLREWRLIIIKDDNIKNAMAARGMTPSIFRYEAIWILISCASNYIWVTQDL